MAKRNQTSKEAPKAPKQETPSPAPAPVGDVDFSQPAAGGEVTADPSDDEPGKTPPVDNDHIAPGSEKFTEPKAKKKKEPEVTPTESQRVRLNGQLERLSKLPQTRGVLQSIAAVEKSIAALK